MWYHLATVGSYLVGQGSVRTLTFAITMRWFFEISYLGTAYNGWQTQPNGIGIQQVVEEALSKILRQPVTIIGSGRTDTGVHCAQQFFQTDLDDSIDASTLIHQLNSLLPRDIAIGSVRAVQPDASARYDARARTYRYLITCKKDPLLTGRALLFFKPLDVRNMQAAAKHLIGEHDFQCFSKVKTDVNHFRCHIRKAEWKQSDDRLEFVITANRFLRGMVRAVVGTLLDVGIGKISVREFKQVIESRDRKRAGMNVSADGLYLESVKYPSRIFLKPKLIRSTGRRA